MADNKKYYYLKVKDNFFDSEEMIILQNMQDGYLYSDILMKLYLRSLKNDGKLMFRDLIPYTPSALAQVVRHQVGTVEKALKVFKEIGLIDVLDNGAIYMLDIQNFIGLSSTEADRKREYRDLIHSEMKKIGQMSDKCPDKTTPEIEIKKELKIKDRVIDINIVDIIDYLNEKNNSNYRKDNAKTISLLNKILKDYTLEDVKKVIDIKVKEWKGTDMEKFIRPETLFGNKFESYFNQKPKTTTRDVMRKLLEEELECKEKIL